MKYLHNNELCSSAKDYDFSGVVMYEQLLSKNTDN